MGRQLPPFAKLFAQAPRKEFLRLLHLAYRVSAFHAAVPGPHSTRSCLKCVARRPMGHWSDARKHENALVLTTLCLHLSAPVANSSEHFFSARREKICQPALAHKHRVAAPPPAYPGLFSSVGIRHHLSPRGRPCGCRRNTDASPTGNDQLRGAM